MLKNLDRPGRKQATPLVKLPKSLRDKRKHCKRVKDREIQRQIQQAHDMLRARTIHLIIKARKV